MNNLGKPIPRIVLAACIEIFAGIMDISAAFFIVAIASCTSGSMKAPMILPPICMPSAPNQGNFCRPFRPVYMRGRKRRVT